MTARRRTPVESRWTQLYMDVVFESLQNLGKEEAGATDAAMRLEDAWSELRKRYAKDPRARGPARDRALASCLSMKWPEAAHELARRLEQRCDEAVRKEHDKLVGARAELAELEGMRRASADARRRPSCFGVDAVRESSP